jgi:hypothetical protein
MKLQVIDTTNIRWLGLEFELPDPLMSNFYFPVEEDTRFRVDHSELMADGNYRYWNPHYVVIAREIQS